MNAAIHHMASSQMHADALRDALRNPQVPAEARPQRQPWRRRPLMLLHRLRPAFV